MKRARVNKTSKTTPSSGKGKVKKSRADAKLTKGARKRFKILEGENPIRRSGIRNYGRANVYAVQPTQIIVYQEKPNNIPQDQWELPISIGTNGKYVTLAQYSSKPYEASTLESLSGEQVKALVIERIKKQPSYPTRLMLGVGEVNREKAIQEIIANSSAGKFIIESEQRVIKMMKSELEKTEAHS